MIRFYYGENTEEVDEPDLDDTSKCFGCGRYFYSMDRNGIDHSYCFKCPYGESFLKFDESGFPP